MPARVKTVWYCTACGNETSKWMGRCPACGEWNTIKEAPRERASSSRDRSLVGLSSPKPVSLKEIPVSEDSRILVGNRDVERVLGGGIVPGSMILLGGEPGIGKSTLALQIPLRCKGLRTLYVSGEESPRQIKLRAMRLLRKEDGEMEDNCTVLGETLVDNIIKYAQELTPDLLVVDSIQTIYTDSVESAASSVTQIRECAARLLRLAKESGIPVILIGHITKDGAIAGPKVLEHIVDVVLQFEGDIRHSHRILRSIKNRFGSTDELAIFEMTGSGLREVENPSEILTPMHDSTLSGVAVGSIVDGSRPFMIEIQALVSSAVYGMPQRSATGYDVRRLNMLLAVLEKRAGFKLSAKDVFLNVAGGMRVGDTACDLAVVVAILSSNFDLAVSQGSCFAAEVGLSGEIRPVGRIEARIEAERRQGHSGEHAYDEGQDRLHGSMLRRTRTGGMTALSTFARLRFESWSFVEKKVGERTKKEGQERLPGLSLRNGVYFSGSCGPLSASSGQPRAERIDASAAANFRLVNLTSSPPLSVRSRPGW